MSAETQSRESDPPSSKRLVFTLTTGRSGTEALARALGCWRNVTARHEPKPTFGSAFRTVQAAPQTAREFWLDHKLPRLERTRRPIYAETSHLAGKGFLEALFDLGGRPDLIRLERPARDVARSLLALDTIPGRTYKGVKYYFSPWDARPRCQLRGDPAQLHDYQLCYWYALEMAARSAELAALGRESGVRVVQLATAQLNSVDALIELGEALQLGPLGLGGGRRLKQVATRLWNTKAGKKRRVPEPEAELDRLEAELRANLVLRQSSTRSSALDRDSTGPG